MAREQRIAVHKHGSRINPMQESRLIHGHVARHLRDPGTVRVLRQSQDLHFARAEMDAGQYMVGNGGLAVAYSHLGEVDGDGVGICRCGGHWTIPCPSALGCRWYAVTLQNPAYRARADVDAEPLQFPANSSAPPRVIADAVVLRHGQDEDNGLGSYGSTSTSPLRFGWGWLE